MFIALVLAFRQLLEPEMRRPFFLSVLWSLAALVVLWAALQWTISAALPGTPWLQWSVAGLGFLVAPVLGYALLPSVILLFLGFFSEAIIAAVERRHYPGLPPAPGTPLFTALASGFFLMLTGLAVNAAALVLVYWWAAWIPGVNVIVFALVNGYLVGRGYFATVAFRRYGTRTARILWSRHRMEFILAGAAVAALSLVPLLNLVAPMIGLATNVHLVERVRLASAGRRTAAAPGIPNEPSGQRSIFTVDR
jgi:uncharacterized protein involved in cysteine biosynthesis